MIDAALHPQPGEDQLSWSDQEAIDVNALGQLLYASMTGTWPVPPSLPQRPSWGLPAAPVRGLPPAEGEPDQQVWPAPHELNRQIHLLNFNLDRYVKIPERLERVERFVWIVGIVASLVGVVAGGVVQKLLTDALMRPAMNQEQHRTQNPTPPTTPTGP